MERGQFTFYRSFWEAVKYLPKKDKLPVLEAFITFGLDGEEPENLTQTQAACFMLAKPILLSGRNKAENGKLGGKAKANFKQPPSKKEEEIKIKKKINTQTEASATGCGCVDTFFEDFWDKYPVKVGREEAYQVWQSLALGEQAYRQIMGSISAWEKTPRWQNEGGRYVPHPAKFLSAGYWKNMPAAPVVEEKIPKGARGDLGAAELENIQKLLREG